MIAAWFGALKNPEPRPVSAIISGGQDPVGVRSSRKSPIAKAPIVTSTPIDAGTPARSGP